MPNNKSQKKQFTNHPVCSCVSENICNATFVELWYETLSM